ncbi:hypothetical protein LRH25_22565 [Ideonella azotifigens]|uniref:DUF5666 domain-containing protein n=1 Tax=Ideonella azotifigens TaxID=513160 RepID=A0ABP3VPP1_9BURK|nr:hypothetical protein [Ideonella azotifigens]MCD2343114.1 hypothetical protein [Ideonella azotifigens]
MNGFQLKSACRWLGLAVAGLACLPAMAQTAPQVYLERGLVLPTGNVMHAYRVPITDSTGKLAYWDLTMTVTANDAGKPVKVDVVSVKSIKVNGNNFVAGTYKNALGEVCSVATSILSSGRQQASMSCNAANGYVISGSWTSGAIAGHPFELDLLAAGIDKIPNQTDYSWGEVGYANGTFWGCANTGEILSAVQAGDQLTLSGYNSSNSQACGITFTLQP